MYDILSVRREALVRESFVDLFEEAIICVVKEKKGSLGWCLSPAFNDASTFTSEFNNQSNKGVLRLKRRIINISSVSLRAQAGR